MHANLYRVLLIIPIALHGLANPAYAADERVAGFSSEDTLTIHSSEARMDEVDDVIHFAGGFELRANDWYLLAEQASLYGKLDDPETVIIAGDPAVIGVNAVLRGRASMVNGTARRIVYDRNANTIRMEGNATLSRDGHTLNGGEIEYHIGNDKLSAGGLDGIHIRVKSEK
jgi:lipopolysaccharide transport protein LptA